MTARLIFHLGDHKTGSTSIQAALRAGAGGGRILYPSSGNHNGLAKALIRDAAAADQRFHGIAGRLAASDAEIGVISAERFEAVQPLRLMAAIERHFPEHLERLRLIAYVRPHAERVLSSYAERIKGGYFAGELAAFHAKTAASGEFCYLPRFLRWREVFGERFTLRPMIRARLKDRDVVRDFLDFALEGAPFDLAELPANNPSLSLEDLSLLKAMQAVLAAGAKIAPERRNMAGWRLAEHLGALPAQQGTRLAPDRALADDIRASYAGDAAALDREFFDASPMQDALAAATGIEAAQSMDAADHHDSDTLRRIRALSELLAGLLAEPSGAARSNRKQTPW